MIILSLLLSLAPPTTSPTTPPPAAAPDPPVVVRTLQMNPEKPREIVGWWSGPTGLMEIAADGRYRTWSTADRLAPPKESGRWHRDNHAVFWLEPYTIPKVPRRRAALWLENDALMTDLTGEKRPLRWTSIPPRVPADALLGTWRGPGGQVRFSTDLRYRWTAPPSERPVEIAGQRGTWSLGPKGALLLDPMLVAQTPLIIVAERADDGRILALRSPAGTMGRVPPPAPAPIPIESTTADPANPTDQPSKETPKDP